MNSSRPARKAGVFAYVPPQPVGEKIVIHRAEAVGLLAVAGAFFASRGDRTIADMSDEKAIVASHKLIKL